MNFVSISLTAFIAVIVLSTIQGNAYPGYLGQQGAQQNGYNSFGSGGYALYRPIPYYYPVEYGNGGGGGFGGGYGDDTGLYCKYKGYTCI